MPSRLPPHAVSPHVRSPNRSPPRAHVCTPFAFSERPSSLEFTRRSHSPLVEQQLYDYSLVNSVNSFVTGWPNFSGALHYPVNALTGLYTVGR
jgi:hypothetical protein